MSCSEAVLEDADPHAPSVAVGDLHQAADTSYDHPSTLTTAFKIVVYYHRDITIVKKWTFLVDSDDHILRRNRLLYAPCFDI